MPQKQSPGLDIEAIIAGATAREITVPLCLAGALQGEYEALERQLTDAAALVGQSLAGNPRTRIAERMEALREEMAQHLVEFRFRALSPQAWSDLLAAHPASKPDMLFDPTTLFPAVIAACSVDPVMTVDQYKRLAEKLSAGQQSVLEQALWDLNNAAQQAVPFSLLASATAASRTGEK
ncbi:hypothetical protein ACGF07_25455 [Kitasatospora sp. NPDC048194]|uniref:hypothetical protein n=1 Tax=Kitasatospora sp. NPDC048194 TaxID=3364045 RepID=UPI003719CC59